MKRTIAAIFILSILAVSLAGCMGGVVEVTVVLKNSTEYELEEVIFQIPQSSGAYSPMNYIITAEDDPLIPDEEREIVISFVDTDFGNSGFALILAKDYVSPENMDYTRGEVNLERGTNRFEITHDGKTFVITAYGG